MWRQVDQELKVILGYIGSGSQPGLRETLSQTTPKQNKIRDRPGVVVPSTQEEEAVGLRLVWSTEKILGQLGDTR